MKGTIVRCLQELTSKRFGDHKWKAALRKVDVPDAKVFLPADDVDDADVLKIMKAIGGTSSD